MDSVVHTPVTYSGYASKNQKRLGRRVIACAVKGFEGLGDQANPFNYFPSGLDMTISCRATNRGRIRTHPTLLPGVQNI